MPGTLQEGGAAFRTTHWSVVLAAQDRSPEAAQRALADFCQAYWAPLYAFLRHRGHSSSDAQDLTQAFFVHLLEQNTLVRADRDKGRLRTFLLGSLHNFLANEYDRARALKRGGGQQIVSLELNLPEAEAAMFATSHLDEASVFDVTWASNVMKRMAEFGASLRRGRQSRVARGAKAICRRRDYLASEPGRGRSAAKRARCNAPNLAHAVTPTLSR